VAVAIFSWGAGSKDGVEIPFGSASRGR